MEGPISPEDAAAKRRPVKGGGDFVPNAQSAVRIKLWLADSTD